MKGDKRLGIIFFDVAVLQCWNIISWFGWSS